MLALSSGLSIAQAAVVCNARVEFLCGIGNHIPAETGDAMWSACSSGLCNRLFLFLGEEHHADVAVECEVAFGRCRDLLQSHRIQTVQVTIDHGKVLATL